MKNLNESLLFKRVKNWWLLLILGLLALVLGIWCFFTPFSTFLAFVMVFAVSFFVFGILEIVFAISNKDVMKNWGWRLAMGVIDILFGILLCSNLVTSSLVVCFFVAFWILFKSIGGIATSIELQKVPNSDWGWMLALSILLLIVSFFLLFNPVAVSMFTAYIVSFTLIMYGIFAIYASLKMKRIKNDYIELNKKLSSED